MQPALTHWLASQVDVRGCADGFRLLIAGHEIRRFNTLTNAARAAQKARSALREWK